MYLAPLPWVYNLAFPGFLPALVRHLQAGAVHEQVSAPYSEDNRDVHGQHPLRTADAIVLKHEPLQTSQINEIMRQANDLVQRQPNQPIENQIELNFVSASG
jgi:hypothetical protein